MTYRTLTLDHIELSPQTQEFFKDFIRQWPDACPNCNFTHPKDMFRLTPKGYQCQGCFYILVEGDFWPSQIGE